MKVPTVALMSSDCDAKKVTYPILANDSALESVRYFVHALKEAYQEGAKQK